MGGWLLVLVVTALGVLVAGVVAMRARAGVRAADLRALERFARHVSGTVTLLEGEGHLLVGRHEGRRVTVRLLERDGQDLVLQLGVAVDPDIRLRLRAPSFLGRVLGGDVPVGDGARFHAVKDDAEDARRVFVHGGDELARLLDELLGSGRTDEIVAEDGWLYLEARLQHLRLPWLRWFLERMTRLARFYERRPIIVQASERPRFAWTSGGEASCPYCRDAIDPADEELVACDACGTLHHRACFEEHGACTIYGCGGGRARVRS